MRASPIPEPFSVRKALRFRYVEDARIPTCPNCGAATVPPYRFCTACGQPLSALTTPAAPAPYPVSLPPRGDTTLLVIALVVVVVIAVSAITAAVVYNLEFGHASSSPFITKPTVVLTVTKITGGVSILVADIQPPPPPANFKVDIQNATSLTLGTAAPMPTTSGSSVEVTVSGVTFTIRWVNVSGSGVVSQGDTFVVTSSASVGTRWIFLLIWSDGSVLPTNASWQV